MVFTKESTTGMFMKTPTPTTCIFWLVGAGVITNISRYVTSNVQSSMKWAPWSWGFHQNDNNGGTATYAAILNMMAAIDLLYSCV